MHLSSRYKSVQNLGFLGAADFFDFSVWISQNLEILAFKMLKVTKMLIFHVAYD